MVSVRMLVPYEFVILIANGRRSAAGQFLQGALCFICASRCICGDFFFFIIEPIQPMK
jgi:hypothetical protein